MGHDPGTESSDRAQGLTAAIGHRVRYERQRRALTLQQLAATAGISRRMLVNVEQGGANPSIGTLLRLSGALGVSLPALVEPPASAPMTVTRGGEGTALWSGDLGGRGTLVATAASDDAVELWDWVLEPGETHASDAHAVGTRELVHLHHGRLRIRAGEDTAELSAGDAVSFQGDVAHVYANLGSAPARFSMTVFEPTP